MYAFVWSPFSYYIFFHCPITMEESRYPTKTELCFFFCLTCDFLYIYSHYVIFYGSNRNKNVIEIKQEHRGGLIFWFPLQLNSGKILTKCLQHKEDPFYMLILEMHIMSCLKVPLSCTEVVLIILFIYNTPHCS